MTINKRSFAATVLCLLAFPLIAEFSYGQDKGKPVVSAQPKPLAEILYPDGTLKTGPGFQGSFDPKGFRMVPGRGGQPAFVPVDPGLPSLRESVASVQGDENWDDQFGNFYVNGVVHAIVIFGTTVYVGGQFGQAGGQAISGIAKWDMDARAWSSLGSGLNGMVLAISVTPTDVYAGGQFTEAGGSPASCIAKWNISSGTWSALGDGVYYGVSSIAVNGTDVYVGGWFETAGGSPANNIAKWDTNTNTWSTLDDGVNNGVNGQVGVIAVSGTGVYVGGMFTQAGGVLANHIARWDTVTESWANLADGVEGTVWAIAVSGTDLYVGGDFQMASGTLANYIARWDGANWSPLGEGLGNGVSVITVSGTDVYAGGVFTTAGGNPANCIAKWDGGSWSTLGSGLEQTETGNPYLHAIAVSESDIYVGGRFYRAGGRHAGYIAQWDITANMWLVQGSGLNAQISAVAVSGTDVYVGGYFSTAGGVIANNIAKWDGSGWSVLGGEINNGANGGVNAIAVNGSIVYAGGSFTQAGGIPASNIAKWDGAAWSALGSEASNGVDGFVLAIAVIGSNVYVGGRFDLAGGVPASNIALWNGSSWSALSDGMSAQVNTLAVGGADLYAGGDFSEAGGQTIHFIAKWNGTDWSGLGDGTSGPVEAIAVSGTDVYVGGWFDYAGGVLVHQVAKWDGESWSALGDGLDRPIWAIAVCGSDVYAGGWFEYAGGVEARNIAKWDGTSWAALGSGVDQSPFAIVATPTDVCAGGYFTTAGDKPSFYIGRWMIPLSVTSPNGGEVWEAGTSHTITWTGGGGVGNVNIWYSTTGPSPAELDFIAGPVPNNGSYEWTVPNDISSTCRIIIKDAVDESRFDISGSDFAIAGFRVTSPNGGEQWVEGSSQTITWTSVGSYPTVRLELSTDGGSTWPIMIISSTANTGSYPWTAPDLTSSQCLVRVSDSTDGFPSDTSDAAFAIVPPVVQTITVTYPNGGESFARLSTHNITWTQMGVTGPVTIDLYKDGVLQRTLGAPDASFGTFSWTLWSDESLGGGYRIRIWQGSIADESDGEFTILHASFARRMDFNGDWQEDILWRYHGGGAYQGLVLVWLMYQTGSPAPQASAAGLMNAAENRPLMSLISGAIPQSPAGEKVLRALATKSIHKTVMEGGTVRALAPEMIANDAPDVGRKPSPVGRKRTGRKDLTGVPTVANAVDMSPLGPGRPEIASLSFNEVIFASIPDTSWEIVGTGDFNGDQKVDILWRYYGTGAFQGLNDIWFMDGTTFLGEAVFSQVADLNWRIAGTGDFNGDGKTDILWRYLGTGPYQGLNVVWFMDGSTFISEAVFSQVLDTDWKIVGTGDFNGDRSVDILWRYYGTGAYQGLNDVWFLDGTTFLSEAVFSQVTDTAWEIAGTGDFNNDGMIDILWRYYGTGPYQGLNDIWYMDGTAFVSEEVFSQVLDTNWRIVNR